MTTTEAFKTAILLLLLSTSAKAYRLTPYLPADNPTGTGIIVCPGGSYFWLDKEYEGHEVARWLQQNGIAAFVLEYSHGGWGAFAFHIRTRGRSFPAGFNDLTRALDSVRTNSSRYGLRPDRIGCMGFSAGGHLVMHAAEQLAGTPSAMRFVAPMYPVVSMTHPCTHKRSRRGLLGEFQKRATRDSLSLENHVPHNCPPVFLMNCDDDPVVHHHNAELLDSALTAHNIPHHYEHYHTGGHGFGVTAALTTAEAIAWKEKFLLWLHELIQDD
ncbi:MAG: alpha/beta hydrolase [Prevotella sp.]|nr:alpha/beta hydrolase [Prevotella sp.]